MDALWKEDLSPAERWRCVGGLMPILLEDPELRKKASTWEDTHGDGRRTTTNLLLYEDPRHGFVVNALIKAQGGEVPPHDHAHTWTAYGVIEGTERIVRYELAEGTRDAERAVLRRSSETLVKPGFVDVIGPYEAHAEHAETGRTVAIIVRSQRTGIALHAVFDLKTGSVERRPGPVQIPVQID